MTDREPALVALDHVQLAMPPGRRAEDDAVQFYGELLGLTRESKPEPLASRGGCWFANGDVVVHLGVEEPFRPALKAHPAFRVRSLDALVERLEAAGHAFRWNDELAGVRRGHVDDPFGNRIELIADALGAA